jgi:hypothetical protein
MEDGDPGAHIPQREPEIDPAVDHFDARSPTRRRHANAVDERDPLHRIVRS